jgi:hypothetical protein
MTKFIITLNYISMISKAHARYLIPFSCYEWGWEVLNFSFTWNNNQLIIAAFLSKNIVIFISVFLDASDVLFKKLWADVTIEAHKYNWNGVRFGGRIAILKCQLAIFFVSGWISSCNFNTPTCILLALYNFQALAKYDWWCPVDVQ